MRSSPCRSFSLRAHEHRIHQAPEQPRRDHDGLALAHGAAPTARSAGRRWSPAARPRGGRCWSRSTGSLRQLEHGVRDVVHGHHVDRRGAARRQGRQRPAHERLQRRVEHVEGRRPAGGALADDDAGPEDLDREPSVLLRARAARPRTSTARRGCGTAGRRPAGPRRTRPCGCRPRTRSRCRRSARGRRGCRHSSASSSMRRVPSTLISRERSSGSENDTDAAECTMSVTCSATRSRVAVVEPQARLLDVGGQRRPPGPR